MNKDVVFGVMVTVCTTGAIVNISVTDKPFNAFAAALSMLAVGFVVGHRAGRK